MFGIDVTEVAPLQGRRLRLRFADGVSGELHQDHVLKGGYRGVFSRLLDDAFFNQVRVDPELGTIVWPNGADLCPDVLYAHATGKPIVVNGERVMN